MLPLATESLAPAHGNFSPLTTMTIAAAPRAATVAAYDDVERESLLTVARSGSRVHPGAYMAVGFVVAVGFSCSTGLYVRNRYGSWSEKQSRQNSRPRVRGGARRPRNIALSAGVPEGTLPSQKSSRLRPTMPANYL
jgi:hypothetical protein